MRKLNHGATILVLLLLATVAPAQSGKPIRIDENSDWWSVIRENDSDEDLKPQDLDIDASNFRVLGITVGSDDLEAVQKKLGPAHVVTRGDASTGRSQICYAGVDGRTYAAFEVGEVQYGFYLFDRGPKWLGQNECAKSNLVASTLKTNSGLHLGQTRTEVERILGKPTASRQNGDWVYFRQIRKKTSAANLRKAREYYSNLSDKEFHDNYDYFDLSVYIVARFSDGQLVYLGLSRSETY